MKYTGAITMELPVKTRVSAMERPTEGFRDGLSHQNL
jgi:hypothetical protein